jgi:hypothetical protein
MAQALAASPLIFLAGVLAGLALASRWRLAKRPDDPWTHEREDIMRHSSETPQPPPEPAPEPGPEDPDPPQPTPPQA